MADTGWLSFVSFDSVASGDGNVWQYVSRAEEEDSSYAISNPGGYEHTDYIIASEIDFAGSPIPETSVITGIQIRVKKFAGYVDQVKDESVKLCMAGVVAGDSYHSSLYWPYWAPAVYSYYGDYDGEDLWNTGYDQADVENADFGVKLNAHNYHSVGLWCYIDTIQVKIYYALPPQIEPTAIVSGLTFGTHTVYKMLGIIEPTVIASSETFGEHYVQKEGDILANGIPSTVTFGQHVLTREYIAKPFDILRINEIRLQIGMNEKDDSGTVACALVERTNELLYSEELDQGGTWALTSCTIDDEATTAPDGVSTADKIIENSGGDAIHFVSQTCTTLSDSTNITYSVHLKAAERANARLFVMDKAGTSIYGICTLDADNPSISTPGGCTVRVENYGAGWARYIMTLNIASGGTTPLFAVWLAADYDDYFYPGDGTSGLYAWGAQVEEASDTIDYIPTTTAAVLATVSTPVWFNVDFIDVFAITMAVQSETFATAIYILRDVPFPWGFKIRVFNQAGVRIAKTVSWAAKGV